MKEHNVEVIKNEMNNTLINGNIEVLKSILNLTDDDMNKKIELYKNNDIKESVEYNLLLNLKERYDSNAIKLILTNIVSSMNKNELLIREQEFKSILNDIKTNELDIDYIKDLVQNSDNLKIKFDNKEISNKVFIPLQYMCSNHSVTPEIVEYLIKNANADINYKGKFKYTSLDVLKSKNDNSFENIINKYAINSNEKAKIKKITVK